MGLISRVSSRTYRKQSFLMAAVTAQTTESLDASLLEIQGSIEQAEGMLKQLEINGQGDSPTADKIRDLLQQMRSQRKKLFDSLTTVENVNNRMTFMQEMEAKNQNGGLMNGGFPLSSSSKTKFRPPRPPSTDTEEAAAAAQPKKAESE